MVSQPPPIVSAKAGTKQEAERTYKGYSIGQLKDEARSRMLPYHGSKDENIARLIRNDRKMGHVVD